MADSAVSGNTKPSNERRFLALDSPLGPDALIPTEVDGHDALSTCFRVTVSFMTDLPDAAIQNLLAYPITLWLDNSHVQARRPIHGLVRRVAQTSNAVRGFNGYEIEIAPRLWFLSCTADCRVFQNLSVIQIITMILKDHGLTDYEFRLVEADYPVLEYCVQYRESAMAFVSRLMEHVGIFYYHEHFATRHTLIMVDSNMRTHRTEPRKLRIAVSSEFGELRSLWTDAVFRPGRWTLTDYDFQAPSKLMKREVKTLLPVPRMDQHEMFDFPGGYAEQARGEQLARLRIEAEEARHLKATGEAWLVTMDAGRRMEVENGADAQGYLLTEVRHRAMDPSPFGSEAAPSYENKFVAIPETVPFRPERVTPRPVIAGLQTATVVSPSKDDPIYTDSYARVKVHFHWDRYGERSKGNTSCWVRVSQVSAGSHWGSVSIPHAGQEVVVSFLDGDPDRPLIVGRVHNAEKMPPINLPYDKHKTLLRDHGDNKIMMGGKSEHEHVALVTPRALNMVVMRSSARSLSAGADPGADSQSFFGDSVDAWKDPDGLASLENVYLSLDGASDANPTPGNDGTFNVVTQGKNNIITENNNNTWCMGEYNTWVGGWANSRYAGGNYQEIVDANIQIVYGDNTQQTLGTSQQFTEGASISLVLGGSSSTTLIGSTSITIGYALIITDGIQYTIANATEKHVTPASSTDSAAWAVNAGVATLTATGSATITAPLIYLTAGASTLIMNPVAFSVKTSNFSIVGAVIRVNATIIKLG